jgi:serine/threonine protein kinase
MTLAPGSKLGPYEILEHVGAGGMGEVRKARETRLGRIMAIKNVKEQHSERFKQEARTFAAMNHPYVGSRLCPSMTRSSVPRKNKKGIFYAQHF